MAFTIIDNTIEAHTSRKKKAKTSKPPSELRRKLLELERKIHSVTQSYMEKLWNPMDQHKDLSQWIGRIQFRTADRANLGRLLLAR